MIKVPNPTTLQGVIQLSPYAGGITTDYGNSICLTTYGGYGAGTYFDLGVANMIIPNVWCHLAMCRKNNVLRYFFNGKKIYKREDIKVYDIKYACIGGFYSGYYMTGNINYISFVSFAKYVDNFSPPPQLSISNNLYITKHKEVYKVI